MMRAPSARVLTNRVNIVPYVPAQDDEGGVDLVNSYPATVASGVACSTQCKTAERIDETGRVSTVNQWAILFATADLAGLGLKVNDRLDVLADDGVTVVNQVYVGGSLDMAGRGSTSRVRCTEIPGPSSGGGGGGGGGSGGGGEFDGFGFG